MSRLKHKLSLFACILICIVYIGHRIYYSTYNRDAKTIVTDWDALGYYLYLPATIIYQDYKQLAWVAVFELQFSPYIESAIISSIPTSPTPADFQ